MENKNHQNTQLRPSHILSSIKILCIKKRLCVFLCQLTSNLSPILAQLHVRKWEKLLLMELCMIDNNTLFLNLIDAYFASFKKVWIKIHSPACGLHSLTTLTNSPIPFYFKRDKLNKKEKKKLLTIHLLVGQSLPTYSRNGIWPESLKIRRTRMWHID